MTEAKLGDTVAVHYTGTLTDGSTFDSSRQREPLVFTLGSGQVIPGFEQAVLGMQPGETRRTTIEADQAYGRRDEGLVFAIARGELPPGLTPEVGDQYQMRQGDGQTLIVTVQGISQAEVVFDANHPLAGQDLTFDLELMSIND